MFVVWEIRDIQKDFLLRENDARWRRNLRKPFSIMHSTEWFTKKTGFILPVPFRYNTMYYSITMTRFFSKQFVVINDESEVCFHGKWGIRPMHYNSLFGFTPQLCNCCPSRVSSMTMSKIYLKNHSSSLTKKIHRTKKEFEYNRKFSKKKFLFYEKKSTMRWEKESFFRSFISTRNHIFWTPEYAKATLINAEKR